MRQDPGSVGNSACTMLESATTREGGAVRRHALLMPALAMASAAALAVSAHLRIPLPFTPVPVTLQTLVVLCAGALLGARWGMAAVALYLGMGAAGLPVTTSGALIGPTTGYLFGFLFAAGLVGAISRADAPLWRLGLAMLAGTAVIYLCGASWLAALTGATPAAAVALYVLPFVAGDMLKAAGAIAAVRGVRGVWPASRG